MKRKTKTKKRTTKKAPARRTRRRPPAKAKTTMKRRTKRRTRRAPSRRAPSGRRRRSSGAGSGRIDLMDLVLGFASGGAAVLAIGAGSRFLKPHLGQLSDFAGVLGAAGVGLAAQKLVKNPVVRYGAIGGAGVAAVAGIVARFVPQLLSYIDDATNPTLLSGDDGQLIMMPDGSIAMQQGGEVLALPAPQLSGGGNNAPLSGGMNSDPLSGGEGYAVRDYL